MSDFSPVNEAVLPTHLNVASMIPGSGLSPRGLGAPTVVTWTSGLAIYTPITIPWPYPVRRVFWGNGSNVASTSVDMGLYALDKTKIFTITPQTQVGASALQYFTLTTEILLQPGSYYLAWTCNNTTSRGFASALAAANGVMAGVLQEASVATLPATMTPATYAGIGIPFCGLTRTPSGF